MSLKKVKSVMEMVEELTIEERIYQLQMNPDRADVIVPASDIYIKVMEWAHASSILVPDVGLKDGILLHLLERNVKQKKIEFKKGRF
jgi:exopolyphosphatase / guanosine-5'-triphosphate,3'-diphosphate pyrophosphatase